MKHSQTKIDASPFYKKVSHWINLMCYALKGLEYTENCTLENDLREIKRYLNYEKTDDANATLFFEALNALVIKHQHNIALIPIIVHLKKNILNNLNPISREIPNLQENEESKKLITDFQDLTKKFNKPTDNKTERRIYDIFMTRLTKHYRLKRRIETLLEQILLQFKAIAVILYDNKPNIHKILELKLNIDNFIKKLIMDIKDYETRCTLEDNCDYEQLKAKRQQICREIKEFINSTFDITNVGLPLHLLVLALIIKSLEKLKTPSTSSPWLNQLQDDLHHKCLNSFNIKTYTTILEAIEYPDRIKSKYSLICRNIVQYLNKPKALESAFYTLSTPLQKITSIRFPQSLFPDLVENYTLLQDTKYDLSTVVNQDLFLSEIGRDESAYTRFFFPEDICTEVRRQISEGLDHDAQTHWSQFRIPVGRQKLELFKQYLFKLGITSEYLQNYIAVALVQQAVEIKIAGQDRLINFSLTVPGGIRTKLLEMIKQFNFATILIRNSSNEPQTRITYDQNNRCVVLSFTDDIVADIDRPNSQEQITIGTAQYFIKLYEDHSKLPEFIFDMYLANKVLQLSDRTKLDLIQMISRYFNQADIPQLSLEDRRLIVLNKILNDSNGDITLNLLQDEKLSKKLRLTENEYVDELKQIIQEKLKQANRKVTKKLRIALQCLDIRRSSMTQTIIDELSLAQQGGKHSISPYLNGCQNLSLNKILSNLTKSHPNLQILYIRNLPKFIKVGKTTGSFNFPNLTELYLKDCPELKKFEIDAPNLRKLQVIKCPNIEKLTTQNGKVKKVNSDIGINDCDIKGCPKLITEFELPSSCFIELLADYADFQANRVDATKSLSLMYGEVSRGNYDQMFFGKSRKANEQKQGGEKTLADFDERLQTLGISDKYLRDYVKLTLIQGAGEDILGDGRDLNFAHAASRLICQKLNEVIRSHVVTAGDKLTGISNLIPTKIEYNAVNESVCLEFADSLSIYEDYDKQNQLGFARYSITIYADRSKLPEFTCNLDLYNSVTVSIAGQKLRPVKIFNPNNIRSLFVEAFTTLKDRDTWDEKSGEILASVEKIAQLIPCYAALHTKLFPRLAVSKHGTQDARFAMLYLIKWLVDLTTKPGFTDLNRRVIDYAQIFREHFAIEDHTISLNSNFECFAASNNGRIILKQ